MTRMFMRLDKRELSTLKHTQKQTLRTRSLRATILTLCDSELVRRLSYISRSEVELRKISVNVNQIIRRIDEDCVISEDILTIRLLLDNLIDMLSVSSAALKSKNNGDSSDRKEIAIWLDEEEKQMVSSVKRILRFRTYRSTILSLCKIADENGMPVDVSGEYENLHRTGVELNQIARALNGGTPVELDSLSSFFHEFYLFLSCLNDKISGGESCT